MVASALSGFAFSLSLIVAIGAQNSFVLRQGLRREHVGAVVAICAASDVALIAAGVAGTGAVIRQVPGLLRVVQYAGVAFLLGYGLLALRRAVRPSTLEASTTVVGGRRAAIVTAFALTYLNPGVYLDTVILLGSIANTHRGTEWAFGAGAALASVFWFVGVGYGARALGPVFAKPLAWRVLDIAIAAIMVTIAARLAFSGSFAQPGTASGTGHAG